MREVGFVATSVGSAKTGHGNLIKHKVVDYFTDRHVVLVADKDEDGRKYAAKVAPVYATVAASVKIIEMPDDGIKDPADFIEKHGQAAKEMIDEIVVKAPLYEGNTESSKPEVVTETETSDKTKSDKPKKKKEKAKSNKQLNS